MLTFSIICTCLSVLILGLLLYLRKLRVAKDYFFLLFVFQVFIYLFLVPSSSFHEKGPLYQKYYLSLQWQCLFFYYIPLILSYTYFYRVLTFYKLSDRIVSISLSGVKSIFLFLFITLFSVSFLVIAIDYGVFFRRIGHEALYQLISSIPRMEFVVYKLYSDTGTFIAIVLFVAYKLCNKGWVKKILKYGFIIHILVYGFFVFANNRLQTLILFLTLYGIYLIVVRKHKLARVGFIGILIAGLFSLYLIKVVVNVRNEFLIEEGKISLRVLDPFYSKYGDEGIFESRLDGLELIAKISPHLDNKGYAYWEPWIHNVKIVAGSVVNSEYYRIHKSKLETNARSVIMRKYFGYALPDHNQSQITDLYLSFGFIGLIIASLFISFVFAYLQTTLILPTRSFEFLFALFIIPYLIEFEKDFMNIIIGWIKYLPIFLLVWMSSIIRIGQKEGRFNETNYTVV